MIKRIGRIWPMLIPVAVGIYLAFLANGVPSALAQVSPFTVLGAPIFAGVYGPQVVGGTPVTIAGVSHANNVLVAPGTCSLGAYPAGTWSYGIQTAAGGAFQTVIAYPATGAGVPPVNLGGLPFALTGTAVQLSDGTVVYSNPSGLSPAQIAGGLAVVTVTQSAILAGTALPPVIAGYAGATGNGLCLNPPPPAGYYLTTNSNTISLGQTVTFSTPTYFGLTNGFPVTANVNPYGPFMPGETVTCDLFTNNNPTYVSAPIPGPFALEEPPGTGAIPALGVPGSTINTTIQPAAGLLPFQPGVLWASTAYTAGLNGSVTGTITLPSVGPQPGSYFVIVCWGNQSFRVAAGPNPPMFFFGVGAVPEASTLLLFGGGLSGLAGYATLKVRSIRNRIGL